MDQILIKDLVVRGIVGINPDERVNRQDILVNVTMWADTSPAAAAAWRSAPSADASTASVSRRSK